MHFHKNKKYRAVVGGFFVGKAAAGSSWNGMKMPQAAGWKEGSVVAAPSAILQPGQGLVLALGASPRGSAGAPAHPLQQLSHPGAPGG